MTVALPDATPRTCVTRVSLWSRFGRLRGGHARERGSQPGVRVRATGGVTDRVPSSVPGPVTAGAPGATQGPVPLPVPTVNPRCRQGPVCVGVPCSVSRPLTPPRTGSPSAQGPRRSRRSHHARPHGPAPRIRSGATRRTGHTILVCEALSPITYLVLCYCRRRRATRCTRPPHQLLASDRHALLVNGSKTVHTIGISNVSGRWHEMNRTAGAPETGV